MAEHGELTNETNDPPAPVVPIDAVMHMTELDVAAMHENVLAIYAPLKANPKPKDAMLFMGNVTRIIRNINTYYILIRNTFSWPRY